VIAEVNALELHGRSAAPTRQHKIVLCCAQSVQTLVEEVAHSLSGLGFSSRVVCGAEARAALLGRNRDPATRNEPTIYVVCVQGTLKEQVLQPLRQALATHGGPNEHLFVAVLDLSLPLGMVGQIRRFADALERMPGRRRRDPVADRRQWREHFGRREFDGIRTRAHVPLHVVERAATRPGVDGTPASERVTGPLRIVSGRKPAKIAPTKKYRALTGAFGVVPESPPSGERRRRGRRRAIVPPAAARRAATAGTMETKTRRAGGDQRLEPRPSRATEPKLGKAAKAPSFGDAIATSSARPRRIGIALVGLAALGAVWITGLGEDLLARFGSDQGHGTVSANRSAAAEPVADEAEAEAEREIAPARTVGVDPREETLEAAQPPEPEPASDEEAPPELDDAALAAADADEPENEAPTEPVAVQADEGESPDADPKPEAGGHEALEQWVEENRLRKVRNLYVSARQGERTTWDNARNRCRQLQVAGVEGWRLAHRRELKLLDVAGFLVAGRTYWSHTRVPDDPEAAYALDSSSRGLVQYLRQEPTGDVICVLPEG
jgi:hypothetical protein